MQWGKDRPPTGQFDGFSPAQAQSAYPQSPAAFFPQYGQPGPMSPQCKHSVDLSSVQFANVIQPPLRSANTSSHKLPASSRKPQACTRLLAAGLLKAACHQALVVMASLRHRKAFHQWVEWVNLKASLSVAAMVATRARSLVVSMFRAGTLATTTPSPWFDRPLDSAAGCCHPTMPVGS